MLVCCIPCCQFILQVLKHLVIEKLGLILKRVRPIVIKDCLKMVKLIFAVLLRSQVDSEVAFMVIFQLIELEIVTLLHNLSALSAVL